MSAEEIKALIEPLEEQIREHREEIEVLSLKIKMVQARCRHPERYETSCMGDSGTRCPDCGHVT